MLAGADGGAGATALPASYILYGEHGHARRPCASAIPRDSGSRGCLMPASFENALFFSPPLAPRVSRHRCRQISKIFHPPFFSRTRAEFRSLSIRPAILLFCFFAKQSEKVHRCRESGNEFRGCYGLRNLELGILEFRFASAIPKNFRANI